MNALSVIGLVFFSVLAVCGLMTANGVTGNLVAGCDCVTSACVKACGDSPTMHCCTAQDETVRRIPSYPVWPSYAASFIGLAGFFIILAVNKKEEEMY